MNTPEPVIYAPDRTTYLGGSDVAAILNVSPWTSPFLLYQRKIGEYVEEITEEKEKIFNRGKRWEPIVVEMTVDELRARGHDVQIIAMNQRYQDPEHSFIAAEIDMELLIDGEEMNVEAKTVNPFAVKSWGPEETDEIPIYYAAQVMHGLMIKPRRRTIVAALTGFDDKPKIYFVDRDEETIAGIRAREVAFWASVQDRTPPAPTTLDDVSFLYKCDGGTVIEADDELLLECKELQGLKSDGKRLEAEIEKLSTKIKIKMGAAATLVYQGKTIATWKNNKDSVKTDWKALADTLLSTKCNEVERFQYLARHTTTTTGNRPFNLK